MLVFWCSPRFTGIFSKFHWWKRQRGQHFFVIPILILFYTCGLGIVVLHVMVLQPHRFSLRFLTYLWWFNHTRVLFQTGEGYAAIQRAACSGGWGQSDESCAGFVTTQSISFNYVKASAPYRYNWCLEQVMSGFLKKLKWPLCYFQGLGERWFVKKNLKQKISRHFPFNIYIF